jgi:hypothetical protein
MKNFNKTSNFANLKNIQFLFIKKIKNLTAISFMSVKKFFNSIKYIFSFNTKEYYLPNAGKKIRNKFYFKEAFQLIPRNSNLSRGALNSLTMVYVPLAIGFLIDSPTEFLFYNVLSLSIITYYKKIGWLKLLIINIFFMVIWVFFVGWYMYLLTHEPSFPLNCGDRIELTPENLFLVVCYSTQVESVFRCTFVETLILVFMLSRLFNSDFTLFFFI